MPFWSSLTRVRTILSTMPARTAILPVLLLVGAGCTRTAGEKFHGDSLKIDNRYAREIEFDALDTRVPLRRGAYVRVEAPVADTREHLHVLLRELGVTGKRFSLTNPATNGMQMHLRFRDGKECSFIWVRPDADGRLTQSIDIQTQMLSVLAKRADRCGVSERITTHLATPNSLGDQPAADFILAFWRVHEVPDQHRLPCQIRDLHKPNGLFLLVEPIVDVVKRHFVQTLQTAKSVGFSVDCRS